MRKLWGWLAALLLLLVALPAAADVPPEDVVATKRLEQQPAASADALAWMARTRDGWNYYVKPVGEAKYRVNAEGMNGAGGGIDGTTLVFQEYDDSTGSDIRFVELTTAVVTDAPAGVNTDAWEYWPDISGQDLMFGRLDQATGDRDLIVYDLTAATSQVLASTSGWRRFLSPGQISADYLVWAKGRYNASACTVYVLDRSTGTTTAVPNPKARCQYAPSVDPSGTVYYAESGASCGAHVKLLAYPVGGPVERLVAFDTGVDLGDSYALDNGDGTTSVFFDPGTCDEEGRLATQDIQKVVV